MKLQRTKQQHVDCQPGTNVVMQKNQSGPNFPATSTLTEPDSPQQLTEPRETAAPEEQFFRSYLHHRLPKLKAPAALKDRIRSIIENPPA